MPRLVVKIVGGKQVRRFVEEQEEEEDRSNKEAALVEASIDDFERLSEKPQAKLQSKKDSALWAAIQQVPDRLCVTAPSGDRSRSYIHPRPGLSAAGEQQQQGEQRGEPEDGDKAQLSLAVNLELTDWQLSSLSSTEDEAAALDATSRGTVPQSQLAGLFLRHRVPLTLPTFALLLQRFSDVADADQIRYQELLHFIRSSAFPRMDSHSPGGVLGSARTERRQDLG